MEATCILKAFVASAKQYFSCEIEPNLLNLQRHLEIIAALASSSTPQSHEVFDPSDLLAAECFTSFTQIIIHHSHKTILLEKVLPILQNLARKETVLRALQSTFHLHAALALFLQQHDLVMNDPWVLQCLHLLELVTQDIRVSCMEHHLEYLVNSFLVEMNNKCQEIYVPALHILSNLCRRNPVVQTYICCLPNIKQIVKSLASKLCYPVEIAVIYSLSLLANLMMNSCFGEKVFTHKRAKKGLELIVILLTSSDESSSIAALNLFLDLIQIPQCLQFYIKYEKLDLVLQKVVEAYHNDISSLQAARYLKFFWAFADIPEVKDKVVSVLCVKKTDDACEDYRWAFHPLLVKTCVVTAEPGSESCLYAIRIVRVLIESFSENDFSKGEEEMKNLLRNLIKSILSPQDVGSHAVGNLYGTQVELLDLLFSLCNHESFKLVIREDLDIEKLRTIIIHELEWNILSFDEGKTSEAGVDLLLASVALIGKLSSNIPSAKIFLDELLQDVRLISFVASSLSSTCEKRVGRGLYVISSLRAEFPSKTLSEGISIANNKRNQTWLETDISAVDSSRASTLIRSSSQYFCQIPDSGIFNCYPASTRVNYHSRKEVLNIDIDALLKRIKNGLKLQELKSSEILELYEHEIASLSMKEKELENLVHSKSAALQQADRVLIQYKCCQAQKEVETLKLRHLLKESERRSEIANEQCNQTLDRCSLLQSDLKSTKQDLTLAKQQIEKKLGIISDLNDRINQMTEDHDKEQKNFAKLLKDKESEIKSLLNKIQEMDEQLKKNAESYQALEDSKSALRKEMEEAQKTCDKQQKEMKLLEMVCQQHEANLKERDAKIKALTDELDKHKLITGMIHEISSGKANVASLLNK